MILKTSNLLYLFDFDGTIAGSDEWFGFYQNFKLAFKHLHINPQLFDIRWSILTSRPKIDRWFINLCCFYHNIYPEVVFMGPTWTWKFKNLDEEADYKEQIIKSILDSKYSFYYNRPITKVCYIDNNIEMINKLNNVKQSYRYLAINVSDFVHRDYVQLLSGDV